MFLMLKLLLCFCLVGVSYAKTEAEIRQWFIGLGVECNTENPISAEDMKALHEHKIPDNENAKCLMACVFRKATWLDGKGMFEEENAISMMEKAHLEDAAKIENSRKLFTLCKKVNEEAVKDGEKGCERSALLTSCLLENASKMGVIIPTV